MDGQEWTFAGILALIVTTIGYLARLAVKHIFAEGGPWPTLKAWGAELMASHKETLAELSTVSKSNADSIEKQNTAGSAYCRFLRAEIRLSDHNDESKAELNRHVDEIEKGLET